MSTTVEVTSGTAGLPTQVPGEASTVSNLAEATGGISAGGFVQPDIDEELFKFRSDDTPLMQLMLKAKKVKVKSPEVDHYMIDEPRSSVTVADLVYASTSMQAILPLEANDQQLPRPYSTLLVKGVPGYDVTGRNATPGKDLMLFVTGYDPASNNPIVRAVNGPRGSVSDEFCTVPSIPRGAQCVILSNAMYETQKEVDPDLFVPQPKKIYLQKRGMNQIVSDYFNAQKKRIPFTQALIAEAAITNFKVRGNRTLWAGRGGKFKVNVPKMGMQYVYCTEGIRWQVRKELQHEGRWTVEELIGLAKMLFTGEDVPKSVMWLAGKNLLEGIQSIDYKNHPEIQITSKKNEKVGWTVTNFHTIFGDFEIKHEPTLDRLGWSNSGLILDPSRVVHYQYSAEHSSSDRIEGEEATRESILVWDGMALKGSAHIWIDGEGGGSTRNNFSFKMWSDTVAPPKAVAGEIYYLLQDCPGMSDEARVGQLWTCHSVTGADLVKKLVWEEYKGALIID